MGYVAQKLATLDLIILAKVYPERARGYLEAKWQQKHPPHIVENLLKAHDAYHKVVHNLQQAGKNLTPAKKVNIYRKIKTRLGVSDQILRQGGKKPDDWHSALLKNNPNVPVHIVDKLKFGHQEYRQRLQRLYDQGHKPSEPEKQAIVRSIRKKHGISFEKLNKFKA